MFSYMEEYREMRLINLLILITILNLVILAGCVDSKFKTRNEMTPEELEEIDLIYNPVEEEEAIPPFLDGFDGAALSVSGLEIQASELREMYTHLVTFQEREPELAKKIACEEIIRAYAVAGNYRDTVDIAISRLEEIRDQVNSGSVDFASMVVENSQEPGSEQGGGDLGVVRRGMMVPSFEMHAFNDPIGVVSGPFPTIFGWHLILVRARTGENPEFATAEASHLLLFHGLDPANASELNGTNATRLANTSDIEVFAEELVEPVVEAFPHMAQKLLGIGAPGISTDYQEPDPGEDKPEDVEVDPEPDDGG